MAIEVLEYHWKFGDGQESFLQNPDHTYVLPGIYNWSCTVTFENGTILIATGTEYVYDNDYSHSFDADGDVVFNGIITSRTDKCFRHAIPQKIEQGIGWCEYEGEDFPFPVGESGVCKIKDQNEEFRILAIDGSDFRVHELGREDQWKDGESGYEGSEIEAKITLREEVPPMGAAAILQHEQSHAYIKPWDKNVRNTEEYNSEGFRGEFNMDALIRIDGMPTDHSITKAIPFKGQLIFDRICKSENIQIGWLLRGAPWRFIKTQTWLKQIDSAAAPQRKTMSESDWAAEFCMLDCWLARNINPLIDAATGMAVTGDYLGVITGPDGYSGSGVVVGAAGSFVVPAITIGNDFTISVWLRNVANINLVQIGNLTISYTGDLIWNDGVTIQNVILNQNYADWTMLTITRDNTILRIYENGALTNTYNLASIELFNGAMTLFQGECRYSDFRLKSEHASENAVLYLYNDMIENKGDTTCPAL